MSDIKISTDVLKGNSIQLSEASSELNSIQNIIAAATPGAFLYNGQLLNKFEQISSGADQLSAKFHDRVEELAIELSDRAKKFEAANQTNNAAMVNLFEKSNNQVNNSPILQALAGLGQLDLAKANFLLGLGGFTGINIFPLISKLPFFRGEIVTGNQGSYSKEVNITTNINLRDSAAFTGQKLAELPAGSVVTQIAEKPVTNGIDNHTWINVRTSDGKEGWISSDLLAGPSVTQNNDKIATSGPVQGVVPVITQLQHDHTVAIDIGTAGNSSNAIIHSLRGGKVISVGPDIDPVTKQLHDYGNYFRILQDDGKVVVYAHLKNQTEGINVGDTINADQEIGIMGSTGRSTGPHLHLEFRQQPVLDKQGKFVSDKAFLRDEFDPYKYLKDIGIKI